MTKKDYQLIAKSIQESIQSHPRDVDEAWTFLMSRLCDSLKKDNKNFDRNKFYAAVYRPK